MKKFAAKAWNAVLVLGRNALLAGCAFFSLAGLGLAVNANTEAFAAGKEARTCQNSMKAGGTCTKEGYEARAVIDKSLTKMFSAVGLVSLGCVSMGAYAHSGRKKTGGPKAG